MKNIAQRTFEILAELDGLPFDIKVELLHRKLRRELEEKEQLELDTTIPAL